MHGADTIIIIIYSAIIYQSTNNILYMQTLCINKKKHAVSVQHKQNNMFLDIMYEFIGFVRLVHVSFGGRLNPQFYFRPPIGGHLNTRSVF